MPNALIIGESLSGGRSNPIARPEPRKGLARTKRSRVKRTRGNEHEAEMGGLELPISKWDSLDSSLEAGSDLTSFDSKLLLEMASHELNLNSS